MHRGGVVIRILDIINGRSLDTFFHRTGPDDEEIFTTNCRQS